MRRKRDFNWGYEAGLDPTGGDGKHVKLDRSAVESVNLWPDESEIPGFYEGIKSYYGQVGRCIFLCRYRGLIDAT
jgi:hypothetical protein